MKGRRRMKVFISQPMRDKTNEQIEEERARAIKIIQEKFPDKEVEVLDTFFKDSPHEAKPLWFLGKSIQLLGAADLAYFIGDWKNYRGCRTEKKVCDEYGIESITE